MKTIPAQRLDWLAPVLMEEIKTIYYIDGLFEGNQEKFSRVETAIQRLQRVLFIVEIIPAVRLLNELLAVMHRTHSPDFLEKLPVLALKDLWNQSIRLLSRYLDHARLKRNVAAPLLLPVINNLRKIIPRPPEAESVCFHFVQSEMSWDWALWPIKNPVSELASNEELLQILRRERLIFQRGLLGTFHEPHKALKHLKSMFDATEIWASHLWGTETGKVCLSLRWVLLSVSAAVKQAKQKFGPEQSLVFIQAYLMGPSRQRIFAVMDRFFRDVIRDWPLNSHPLANELQADLIAILSFSVLQSRDIRRLVSAWNIENSVTDADMLLEYQILMGPDLAVLQDVIQSIVKDVAAVEDLLMLNRQSKSMSPIQEIQDFAERMMVLSKTLWELGVSEASLLRRDTEKLRSTDEEIRRAALARIVITLIEAENQLRLRITPLPQSSKITSVSTAIYWMEAAASVVEMTVEVLCTIEKGLSSFVDAHQDSQYIQQLDIRLQQCCHPLTFMGLGVVADVLASLSDILRRCSTDSQGVDDSTINKIVLTTAALEYALVGYRPLFQPNLRSRDLSNDPALIYVKNFIAPLLEARPTLTASILSA
ncbi:MAG: hypothetical protein V4629_08635 [Pseudomonadota bacterium]